MKFPVFRSVRIHLLILVFISALPALGIIIYSGLDRQHYDIGGAREDALRVMRNLAQDHERTMASTRQFLMTLAQLPDVQNRNAPACNKLFRKLHRENPLYSTILAANAEGMVFANAVPAAPFSIRKRKYFLEILRTKEFAVGEYIIGAASQIPLLPCAYPVLDSQGRIKGFVVAGLDLESYDRMFKKTKLPEGSALALSDHKHIRLNRYPNGGDFIGKADNPEMIKLMSAQPEEGTFTAVGGDGIRRLYAYKRFYLKDSTTPYLFMRVGMSEDQALSGARKNMLINMGLLCFALISVMVLAWYLGKILIVQRLNKLVDATTRLRNGDLTIRTGLGYGEDELGQLTKAFDEMAGELEHKDLNRRLAEEALKESETRYRTLIETTRDLIYTTNRKGFLTYVNPPLERALGYTHDEWNGKSFAEILAPEYVDKARDIFRRAMKGESVPVYEADLIRKDRTRISAEFNVTTLFDKEGKSTGRYGIGRDITERKRIENELETSKDFLEKIMDLSPFSMWISDAKGTLLRSNQALRETLKVTDRQIVGIYNVLEDQNLIEQGVMPQVQAVFSKGTPARFSIPWEARKGGEADFKGARDLFIDVSMFPIKDNQGKVINVVCQWIDITERKRAEEKLRESEEQYRLLVENANDAIFILQDGLIKFHNLKTEIISGYTKEELSQIPFVNHVHPQDRNMVLENHMRRLKGEDFPPSYSFRAINKTGEELWTEVSSVRIVWEEKPAVLCFVRDVTEQKRLESQLLQAQKMEAIGTLAGGIAHDFNNLLMAIQGYASSLLMETDPDDPRHGKLKVIEGQVEAGANLTKQLLGFARVGKYDVKPLDMNKVLERSSTMFGRTKKEITIHRKFQEDLWAVEADTTQIDQVFMNLYVNAWQAMPEGGNLYLETANMTLTETDLKHPYMEPGRYVKISVTDTGTGMDEKTKERIFEPFFTTKEMGRGTGLGLAMVYGIVKGHKGYINVYSEPGHGTTFTIYLPATEKETILEEKLSTEVLKGGETILLVDDEDEIRNSMKDVMEILGYHFLTAASGPEALRIYEENKDRIDLVILDMIMPGMGGGETFDRLKAINPDIKVILSSGYSLNGQASEIMARGCRDFIQKPVNIAELSQKIREVLDKKT